ncbi:uncharacterized protein LOC115984142 [Quercus lobata]|uniref:uncharacterized protein LOC115984142 n=1 Tax=Quercus lobata TaxID=97700 RepID=UPI0012459864|nr:uncharacterized protein LOC115984142 [Quercus lobata]
MSGRLGATSTARMCLTCEHVSVFLLAQRPHLKKRYQLCVEKVREYLESIKDFDELVSLQSLFLHFLGSKPSTKVQKDLEVVKKIMTTRFSKQKLAEVQEKKAKSGTASGLLSMKKASDVVKKDSTKTPPPTKCPTSPTLSLEMIAFGGEEIRKRRKSGGKSFLHTF